MESIHPNQTITNPIAVLSTGKKYTNLKISTLWEGARGSWCSTVNPPW